MELCASFLIDGGLDFYKSSYSARPCILFPPVFKQDFVENGLPKVGQRTTSPLSCSHLRSVSWYGGDGVISQTDSKRFAGVTE
ncbi:hypothetical protein P5673_015906 [Acropora cervicornis]|uniref:Uncharacterized protein n=1 Tax=Acropora cervicornis TaxID=6130 RepID=A0AAD9QHE1_ACRCE|nr:hypothetical protein P5673_015906 [Acropora cervicornis]